MGDPDTGSVTPMCSSGRQCSLPLSRRQKGDLFPLNRAQSPPLNGTGRDGAYVRTGLNTMGETLLPRCRNTSRSPRPV
ncbi:hypothetical protein COCON_G00073110 [Conger conger]|uniref:Uncharacterized protein n=1 Tax=Conger conger TaxID=82655 RepID=A0A9Q1DNA0_CONCO|nr:hypothetical protein COCON_G00073110 [Conger conger]